VNFLWNKCYKFIMTIQQIALTSMCLELIICCKLLVKVKEVKRKKKQRILTNLTHKVYFIH